VKKDSSQALEQNDWQEFKPLFGGGKIKICDTLRAVTPFGGLSVLIEFFGRIGLVEQLENRQFYQPKSPNHYDPGQILIGFIASLPELSVLPIPISYGPIEHYRRYLGWSAFRVTTRY
jgi:hypothetical protein